MNMRLVAGKVGVTAIVIVAFLVGLGAMMLVSGDTPTATAARFMKALSDGDHKTLTEMSYSGDVSKEELAKQWEYTMTVAAPHYQFSYEIKGETQPSKDSAIVWMMFTKNVGAGGTYPERFDLPLVRTEDGWKVDVFSMNRDMFPGLPRG
jgi:hypothetical protein